VRVAAELHKRELHKGRVVSTQGVVDLVGDEVHVARCVDDQCDRPTDQVIGPTGFLVVVSHVTAGVSARTSAVSNDARPSRCVMVQPSQDVQGTAG
jgi:hypothetical protein